MYKFILLFAFSISSYAQSSMPCELWANLGILAQGNNQTGVSKEDTLKMIERSLNGNKDLWIQAQPIVEEAYKVPKVEMSTDVVRSFGDNIYIACKKNEK